MVTVDNQAGSAELAVHLAEQGIRSAVFVGGVAMVSMDRLRYRGATTTLADRGIACPYIESGGYSYQTGRRVAATILADERPDAVMAATDEIAFGLIDGFRDAGIDIPGDMLVTGFDGLTHSEWSAYDLTTMMQPLDLLVDEALALLDNTRSETDPERPPERILAGRLRIGRTTLRNGL